MDIDDLLEEPTGFGDSGCSSVCLLPMPCRVTRSSRRLLSRYLAQRVHLPKQHIHSYTHTHQMVHTRWYTPDGRPKVSMTLTLCVWVASTNYPSPSFEISIRNSDAAHLCATLNMVGMGSELFAETIKEIHDLRAKVEMLEQRQENLLSSPIQANATGLWWSCPLVLRCYQDCAQCMCSRCSYLCLLCMHSERTMGKAAVAWVDAVCVGVGHWYALCLGLVHWHAAQMTLPLRFRCQVPSLEV